MVDLAFGSPTMSARGSATASMAHMPKAATPNTDTILQFMAVGCWFGTRPVPSFEVHLCLVHVLLPLFLLDVRVPFRVHALHTRLSFRPWLVRVGRGVVVRHHLSLLLPGFSTPSFRVGQGTRPFGSTQEIRSNDEKTPDPRRVSSLSLEPAGQGGPVGPFPWDPRKGSPRVCPVQGPPFRKGRPKPFVGPSGRRDPSDVSMHPNDVRDPMEPRRSSDT